LVQVFGQPFIRIHDHAAKFPQLERSATLSNPHLSVKDRPGGVESDEQADQQEYGQKEYQAGGGA
jgi:hypothetical protein